ncbi:site-specific DNA-methyltransferase [Candidatus Accumulibacter sp. ACC007]|uniref:site-specific DNA-methyltransferase n=1 Tax=Candidatus Accumulibacter sp. ACC007 TaxID=2823333 RepID=UPI0025BD0A1C|nr:site-specific DNA-methyltransferase [Candidatus Accumulibacter sp. ACC007]
MSKKQKLELTWIGKENRPRLEPRILLEDLARSYHAAHRMSDEDIFDNRLIFGDNLLALKALEAEFSGKVKCVFIDPPYNTGSAFTHYDDGVEHSIWLSLMRDRLEIIRRLLSEDGSLWITIDDNEAHYLKVLCDEVFGRANFITSVVWQKIYTTKNTAKHFSGMHDYILVYTKNAEKWRRNDLPRTAKQDDAYKNPDSDPRGPWKATPIQARNYYGKGLYSIKSPSGRVIEGPPKGTYWRISEDKFLGMQTDNRIWWGEKGGNTPAQKRFLSEVQGGVVPSTWWSHDEAGHNAEAKNELRAISADADEMFITPKPERLIKRILEAASNPGDLVLDSFAGSGTTGAVAHKMGRRWIMVELGEHCHTHIIPRLKKVIDGEDPGGISKTVNWQGGGGFRYYRLAPSLLEKDKWGNWVINHDYNAAMLAEALCKLEGFTYAPSDAVYWQHGRSTERDFVYVTTASLTHEQLQQLSDAVGPDQSLLVLCTAFRAKADAYPNLTVKKIPNQVLARCEWGHDDYSLQVENLPKEPPKPGQQNLFDEEEA